MFDVTCVEQQRQENSGNSRDNEKFFFRKSCATKQNHANPPNQQRRKVWPSVMPSVTQRWRKIPAITPISQIPPTIMKSRFHACTKKKKQRVGGIEPHSTMTVQRCIALISDAFSVVNCGNAKQLSGKGYHINRRCAG